MLSMEMRTDAQSAGECGSCSAECAATRPLASRSDAARPPGPVAAPAPPPPSSHLWKGNFELENTVIENGDPIGNVIINTMGGFRVPKPNGEIRGHLSIDLYDNLQKYV